MGDPRRMRKKYQGPVHPWQAERILAEKQLVSEYGLKNKRELYKINTIIKSITSQAKMLIAAEGTQAEKEKHQLFGRLHSLGILTQSHNLDDVLGLGQKDLLERRLQTMVYRKGIARTVSQARQFITHRHVTVDGQVVASPGYFVKTTEQDAINVITTSTLSSAEHPERIAIQKKPKKERKKVEHRGRRERR